MTVLIGAASFFVGNAYQAQMPEFARDLGHGRADFAYRMLLAADAAGGLVGGLFLETRGLLRPRARTAFSLGHDLVLLRLSASRAPISMRWRSGCCSWLDSWNSHSIRWRRHWCKSTHRARFAAA